VRQALGTKLYYSIGEVAELTDLQPYTLRAWEKEFACLRPRRVRGKNRAYRERDIGIILLIKRLLYQERYSTRGVQLKLKGEPELVRAAVDNVVIERHGQGPSRDATAVCPPLLDGGRTTEEAGAPPPESSTGAEPAPRTPRESHPEKTPRSGCGPSPQAFRAVLAEVCQDLREVLRMLS